MYGMRNCVKGHFHSAKFHITTVKFENAEIHTLESKRGSIVLGQLIVDRGDDWTLRFFHEMNVGQIIMQHTGTGFITLAKVLKELNMLDPDQPV